MFSMILELVQSYASAFNYGSNLDAEKSFKMNAPHMPFKIYLHNKYTFNSVLSIMILNMKGEILAFLNSIRCILNVSWIQQALICFKSDALMTAITHCHSTGILLLYSRVRFLLFLHESGNILPL